MPGAAMRTIPVRGPAEVACSWNRQLLLTYRKLPVASLEVIVELSATRIGHS